MKMRILQKTTQTGKTSATFTEGETVTSRGGHEPSPSDPALGKAGRTQKATTQPSDQQQSAPSTSNLWPIKALERSRIPIDEP